MNMETSTIRKKLHQFIETIEDKKAHAIYTLFENEIDQDEWEYSDEFKATLEERYEYYKNGGKMITPTEADEQIKQILKSGKGE
jgi:heme-degrading monooxygenase HmoA